MHYRTNLKRMPLLIATKVTCIVLPGKFGGWFEEVVYADELQLFLGLEDLYGLMVYLWLVGWEWDSLIQYRIHTELH